MARRAGRAPLTPNSEQRAMLEARAAPRTVPLREVERAKILPDLLPVPGKYAGIGRDHE